MNPSCPNRNNYCYVCGLFVNKSKRHRRNITETICKSYEKLYLTEVVTNSWYRPEVVCEYCNRNLHAYHHNGQSPNITFHMKYVSPVTWLERTEHLVDSCYFCVTQPRTIGINFERRSIIKYAQVDSVIPARERSESNPCAPGIMDVDDEGAVILPAKRMRRESIHSEFPSTSRVLFDEDNFDTQLEIATASSQPTQSVSDYEMTPSEIEMFKPQHLVSQADFDDLVRDLNLSINHSEILASRIIGWGYGASDLRVTSYRKFKGREKFGQFFTFRKGEPEELAYEMIYCTDVNGLFEQYHFNHVPQEWRLFIDGSVQSLKAVLLHNGNKFPSVPIAYATNFKETYENMKLLLSKIKYTQHKWQICADLKIVAILSGLKGGYAKNQCLLCDWEGRRKDLHYTDHKWNQRYVFIPGEKCIIHPPLIESDNIILPPLHIKLGLVRNFVRALDKEGDSFGLLREIFPRLSADKINAGENTELVIRFYPKLIASFHISNSSLISIRSIHWSTNSKNAR